MQIILIIMETKLSDQLKYKTEDRHMSGQTPDCLDCILSPLWIIWFDHCGYLLTSSGKAIQL